MKITLKAKRLCDNSVKMCSKTEVLKLESFDLTPEDIIEVYLMLLPV